jgi:hypothetical protein
MGLLSPLAGHTSSVEDHLDIPGQNAGGVFAMISGFAEPAR